MLKFLWVLPFLLCLSKNLLSENFNHIDSLSIKTPPEKMRSLDELVSYCETQVPTDIERVRFYFVWVASHIRYDEKTEYDKQNPLTVFQTKKAVCSGYSRLLMQLCEQSNIAVRYVAGYGKDVNDEENIQNHSWNIILIDGKWHFFDVTWAATEIEDVNSSPSFTDWFMTQTEVFQKTHLSFDPAYQLKNQLMTRSDFFNKTTNKAIFTEGVQKSNFDFTQILTNENGLDSLERTWLSFRRAYDFMPMDSAVAIKLAKLQAAKVMPIFDYIQEFIKNDYPKIKQMPVAVRRVLASRLQNNEFSLSEALNLYAELANFPLSDDNKKAIKQNLLYYQTLTNFVKNTLNEWNNEIALRE